MIIIHHIYIALFKEIGIKTSSKLFNRRLIKTWNITVWETRLSWEGWCEELVRAVWNDDTAFN